VLAVLGDRLLGMFVPKVHASASGWFTQYCYCATTTTGRFEHFRECFYPGACCANYHCDRCVPSSIRC
jgi:hypothetical protein